MTYNYIDSSQRKYKWWKYVHTFLVPSQRQAIVNILSQGLQGPSWHIDIQRWAIPTKNISSVFWFIIIHFISYVLKKD